MKGVLLRHVFPIVNAPSILIALIQNEGWEGFKVLIQLGLPTSHEDVGSVFSAHVAGEKMEKENFTPDKMTSPVLGSEVVPAKK